MVALQILRAACIIAIVSMLNTEASAEGIHPEENLAAAVKISGAGSGSYRIFDRESILSRLEKDLRYDAIVEKARLSVAGLIDKSDQELRDLILPAESIRAFMVNRSGCPVHGGGTKVYAPFGRSIDLEHPCTVYCPIGNERYPNKDFPDDGTGWMDDRSDSPTKGQRFYFKGWFQHWFLKNIGVYLKTMAQLWLITGEDVYRTTSLTLLERLAEVYPNLDSNDLTYSGDDWGVYVKTTGSYWEGTMLLQVSEAVEIFHAAMPKTLLHTIHQNIYRAAYKAYRAKPASANWGNNWNPPLAKFASILGDEDMLEFMMNGHPAAQAPVLDNQFFRDGFPFEASLSYASTYHNVAIGVAKAMNEQGEWVWKNPHMRESWHSFARLVCLDKYTHFAADMGYIINNGWTLPTSGIKEAYQVYKTPDLARYLLQSMEINGVEEVSSLNDLFQEEIDIVDVRCNGARAQKLKSTTSAVRGIAILRSGEGCERSALVMDYGYAHTAHSHADRLNINLFAHGQEFIPEMGYPEYMDGTAPATGGWTTHTVCHATVEVDEKRQARGVFGDLHSFADLDGIKFIEASCEDAYIHRDVNEYRRTLALIDVPGSAYALDIFRVSGGNRHDYLFHGPQGDVVMEDIELSAPQPGTLAGPAVSFGEAPKNIPPYHIDNSGYQYLFDVRESIARSQYSASWTLGDTLTFKAHFLPQGDENFILTQGYPRPSSKSLPPMPFLVRRRDALSDSDSAQSTFITALSTEKKMKLISRIEALALTKDSHPSAVAVKITHAFGEDIILSTTEPDGLAQTVDGVYELIGRCGSLTLRNGGTGRMSLVNGTLFRSGDDTILLESPSFTGVIEDVYDDRFVLDRAIPFYEPGTIMFASRGPVNSVYHLGKARGATTEISPTPWIGKGIVSRIDSKNMAIIDGRPVYPLGEDNFGERNYYSGAWLVSEDGNFAHCLAKGGNDGFFLNTDTETEIHEQFSEGKPFFLYDVGPGDTVSIQNSRQLEIRQK